MTVGIIIQARMGSTRLKRKSLKLLCRKPIIQRCFEQCKKSKIAEKVVVAIPDISLDDELYLFCKDNNIPVFRGDHDNLIKRYYECAKKFGIQTIIRITGDNTLIDSAIIDKVYEEHITLKGDYTSTRHWDGNKLSGLYPTGLSVDIFSINALKQMLENDNALKPEEKEHIVFYFCNHSDKFKLIEVAPKDKINFVFTIDTQEDFDKIEKLINYFDEQKLQFTYGNYIKYVPLLFNHS